MIHEDQRIINYLEVRRNGNLAAQPYVELADSLNRFVLRNIDTTFSKIENDSNVIKKRLRVFSEKYLAIYLQHASVPKCKLLLCDDSLLRKPIANFCFAKDHLMSHYVIMQDILFAHMNNLHLFDGCFSAGCHWYAASEKEGFFVNSMQMENGTKVKCHFNSPKWIASYELSDLIAVKDNIGRSYKVTDAERTEDDTLKFTLPALASKDLTLSLLYAVTDRSGERREKELKFPLSLW
jgi:hypothetical protein